MNERVLVQAKLKSLAVAERKHSLKLFSIHADIYGRSNMI